jgi:hypothetical protein
MSFQIGQIPTHYPAPGGAYKIEVENPTGPTSGFSTLGEVLSADPGIIDLGQAQVAGALATAEEVETNTKACRIVLRPDDIGVGGGYYLVSNVSPQIAMGAAGISFLSYSFRWPGYGTLCSVRKILVGMASGPSVGLAAGAASVFLTRQPFYLVSMTGVSGDRSPLIAGSPYFGGTLKTRQPEFTADLVYLTGSSGLTPPSGNFNPQEEQNVLAPNNAQVIGQLNSSVTTTSGQSVIPPNSTLFEAKPGEHPLVLDAWTGFNIHAIWPAAVTSQTAVFSWTVYFQQLGQSDY